MRSSRALGTRTTSQAQRRPTFHGHRGRLIRWVRVRTRAGVAPLGGGREEQNRATRILRVARTFAASHASRAPGRRGVATQPVVRAFSSCPTREDGRSGLRSIPHMAHALTPSGTSSAQRGQRSRSSVTVVLRRNSPTASPFGSEPPIIAQGARLIHAYKTPFDATRREGTVSSARGGSAADTALRPTAAASARSAGRAGPAGGSMESGRATSSIVRELVRSGESPLVVVP